MNGRTLADQAAGLFRSRQARARELVRQGSADPRSATRDLAPWLAIACLCGADLPELESELSGVNVVPIWSNAPVAFSKAQDRGLLADRLCPRSRWAPILAAARDRALMGPLETPEQCRNARALDDVARALAFDPNGKWPVPHFDHARGQPAGRYAEGAVA